MRIAVWHNLPSGGGKRALTEQLSGLARRGHAIRAWSPPTADLAFLPLNEAIEEHVVPLAWDAGRDTLRFRWLRKYEDIRLKIAAMDRHCVQCAEEINTGDFDVLFAQSCMLLRLTSIARHVRLPSVIYLHEPNRALYEASPTLPWIAAPSRRGPAWTPRALKRALRDYLDVQALRIQAREERDNAAAFDRILVNSFYTRESVLAAYGLDSRVCYLGIDSDHFRPLDVPREHVVVGLGAIHPSKGLDVAVRAVASVEKAKRPALIWVGNFADERYRERVETLASTLGVDLSLRIRVADDEVVRILNTASVMIYTSSLEPFGFAPLEANACGVPVVAIAEGGVRESIVDELNGVLVPERDPVLLGRALSRFLDEPAWAAAVGTRAREHVVSRWGWHASVDRLERTLEEAATGATA